MNTTIPEHLQTTGGFVHAAFEAFDAELESQLGIKVDDFKEVYDATAEQLEKCVEDGTSSRYVVDDLCQSERLGDYAASIELHDYIRLNPDFDKYIDLGDTQDNIYDALHNSFIDLVVKAPERAICTYFKQKWNVDPMEGWVLIDEDNDPIVD